VFDRCRSRVVLLAAPLWVAAGLVAAAVLSFSSDPAQEENLAATEAASSACREGEREPPPAVGGGHPEKSCYGPNEKPDGLDLLHVVNDGYVIVRYDDQLPVGERRELEAWVLEGELAVIAAADEEQTEPVRAVTARRELSCSEMDLAGLTSFRDRWFESLRS
jgi:hypothetical protein